ncbi:hypothetical protein T08_12219 [Trichinella sp. T8]|nr:hypothetical protein T08_12219 [Trichinella sp. T8]
MKAPKPYHWYPTSYPFYETIHKIWRPGILNPTTLPRITIFECFFQINLGLGSLTIVSEENEQRKRENNPLHDGKQKNNQKQRAQRTNYDQHKHG